MFSIDYEKLHSLERAFVLYEMAYHNVDPRKQLDGTTFRIKSKEGYKQYVYDELHRLILKGGPYTDILRKGFNTNLASYRQKPNIEKIAASENADELELALMSLYEGNDDKAAFKDLVSVTGGNFDVIGLLFFLKDCENYLPVRSELFDERFKSIGVDSKLSHNCTWNKYTDYNETIKEIHRDLKRNVNGGITLIDAHSFVWILNVINEYNNSVHQLVKHEELGIGEIISREPDGPNDEKLTVKYANKKDSVVYLRSLTIDAGKKLRLLDPNFDIDGSNEKKKNTEFLKALAEIDTTELRKYIVLHSKRDDYKKGTVRSPYYDYSGKKRYYWDTLSELKPGDLLFNYNEGIIKAVGIVTSYCHDVPISELQWGTEEWGDTRRQVDYKPFELDNPINIADYRNEIIKYSRDKNSAFDKNGGVNRGYVYELEPELADLFARAIGIESIGDPDGKELPDNSESYTLTQADLEKPREDDVRSTMEWIITAKQESKDGYRALEAFRDLGRVHWHKSKPMRGVSVNDIVYIYIGVPYSKIMLRTICRSTEYRPSPEEFNKELIYYNDVTYATDPHNDEYLLLEETARIDTDELSLKVLNSKGLVERNIQGSYGSKNNPELFSYIDSVFSAVSEEKPLSNKAIEVAEALLKLIANRMRLTTYGELSDMTRSKPSPYYEMRMLLDAINKRCDKLGLPYISAMVVNKSTGLPGEGFRDLCIDYFGYDPEMTTEEIFEEELDRIGKCDEWYKLADYLGIEMPAEDEEPLPEEVEEVPGEPIIEGAKKTITVNSYERDPKAKKLCKDYYMKRDGRITCQVCGFNFGEVYGPEYANKIHVHHIVPVSKIGEEYIVDPIKDLIPVCPNCHMILHAGKGISVEELRKKVKKNNN